MPIIEPVIRPPSEAESFFLQVTTGCSSNHCTFCGAYQGKPFRIKSKSEIRRDIKRQAEIYPEIRRVFLMDGDALVIGNNKLVPILKMLNEEFPKLTRISSYANGYNIVHRTEEELRRLYALKLRLVYIGLESGNQQILDLCNKKSTAIEMISAVRELSRADIKSSVIVLLGLGGRKFSQQHVRDTIIALNQMQPRYLSFLSLMLIPGTPLHKDACVGKFEELTAEELLQQAHDIIKGLELKKTIFRSNHASNHLALEGRFPSDKEQLLDNFRMALAGEAVLRPEWGRGL
ncbi:MAG: radical SAM protein [Candidatus Omnitrophota bacterium]